MIYNNKIPPDTEKWLAGKPETGMGYQVISVLQSDGTIIKDIVVCNGQFTQEKLDWEQIIVVMFIDKPSLSNMVKL